MSNHLTSPTKLLKATTLVNGASEVELLFKETGNGVIQTISYDEWSELAGLGVNRYEITTDWVFVTHDKGELHALIDQGLPVRKRVIEFLNASGEAEETLEIDGYLSPLLRSLIPWLEQR